MSEKELTLTEADKHTLSRLPEGWFDLYDVPFSVRCPEFRLNRLVDRDLVKREIVGQYPDIRRWRYRKVKQL
jgi:hypothetical protein